MNAALQFFICALACWRLSHLLSKEDGPWDIIFRIRKQLGQGFFGSLLDCFYCVSIWIALPLALWWGTHWTLQFIGWLAISGAACLLEQATTANKNNGHQEPPYYQED